MPELQELQERMAELLQCPVSAVRDSLLVISEHDKDQHVNIAQLTVLDKTRGVLLATVTMVNSDINNTDIIMVRNAPVVITGKVHKLGDLGQLELFKIILDYYRAIVMKLDVMSVLRKAVNLSDMAVKRDQ